METQAPEDGLFCLWATDGSSGSLATAATLQSLVLRRARSLRCLAVAPVHQAMARHLPHLSEERRSAGISEAQEAAARSLAALGPLPFPAEAAARWGNPAVEIAHEAAEHHVDLVVVAASSRAAPSAEMNLGGTARALIQTIRKPLFIARPLAGDQLGPVILLFQTRDTFAYTVDLFLSLGLPSHVQVYLAAFLKRAERGRGMLITLNEKTMRGREGDREVRSVLIEDAFRRARDRLADAGYSTSEVRTDGDLVDELKDLASRVKASLVVTATGSAEHPDAPQRIAAGAPCSVLIAP